MKKNPIFMQIKPFGIAPDSCGFDEAGAGNTIAKFAAPVFDPTCERLGLKLPSLLDSRIIIP